MKRIDINDILSNLFACCYLAIIFFVPLYFGIWPGGNNLFELNKIVLFRVLVWLMLFLAITRILYFSYKSEKIDWRKIFIMPKQLAILLLLASSFGISAILAQDRLSAFWGYYFRQQGLYSLYSNFLFFGLLWLDSRFNKAFFNFNRVIVAAVLSSWLVSIYGIVQMSGWDFFDWSEPAYLTGRVSSSFGQPNFLASFLLLVIPLAVYLFFKAKKTLVKFFWLLVSASQLLCLFFTHSRGGWIALIAGMVIMMLVFLIVNRERLFGMNNYRLYIRVIALCIFFIFGLALYFQANSSDPRIAKLFNLQNGSVAARIKFWQAGIKAIEAKPFFGYGPDNQGEALIRYYQKDWGSFGNVNAYPDRAHNMILDTWLGYGVVGLLLYLALLYLLFKTAIKNIRYQDQRPLIWAILSGIACYLFSLLFSFEVVTTGVYFWLYLALIMIIDGQADKANKTVRDEDFSLASKKLVWLKLAVLFICFAITATLTFRMIGRETRQIVADYYFQQMRLAFLNQEYFQAYVLYGYLKEQNIRTDYYDLRYGSLLAENFNYFNTIVLARTAEKTMEEMLKNLQSDNFDTYYTKGRMYTVLAGDTKQQYFIAAEENLRKAQLLSPELPKTFQALASLYSKKKDYSRALDLYDQALNSLPDTEDPNINSIHVRMIQFEKHDIFLGLGDDYFAQKKYDLAEKYYQLAHANNFFDIAVYKKIADTYYLRGQIDQAIFYNRRGWALNAVDFNWPLALAALYLEKGDRMAALSLSQQALALSPNNETIKSFIKTIK